MNKSPSARSFAAIVFLLAEVLSVATLTACSSQSFEADSNPPFTLDPTQPFHLEFGRGSGWHGLGMFILDQSGHATISRLNQPPLKLEWVQTELTLPPSAVAEIVAAVNAQKLTSLNRAYYGHVADGTQWVFLLTQGSHKKTIYFDNVFPEEIEKFAESLDDFLAKTIPASATWTPCADNGRTLAANLWSSLR